MKRIVFLLFIIGTGFAYAQTRPAWADNPSSVYPNRLYVSAVGIGRDRQRAEGAARGALTAYFKQSVTSSTVINDVEWQEDNRSTSLSFMSQSIEAAASLDSLMGAEIKNAWEDRDSGNWYAAAVMEKAVCRDLYAAEIDKAVDEIGALLDISQGISFETIAKCQRAQGILEKAAEYARILSILDGPNRQPELSGIGITVAGVLAEAKTIPVNVRIQGDVDDRFAAAFAGVFTAAGFRTGNHTIRFALEGAVSMAPAPRNQYFNTRYTIDAVLRDTRTGTELFTYHAASRESHMVSQDDADYRAAIGAERRIKEEFPKVLQAYLDLP